MEGKTLARIGAVVFASLVITATAIQITRKDPPAADAGTRPAVTVAADPLRDELIHCTSIGEAGPRDQECLRAWAENRRRFLAPDARPQERLPTPPAATPAPSDAATLDRPAAPSQSEAR